MCMLLLIILLILLFGGGGFYGYRSGYYGPRGMGLVSILLIVLVVFLLMGGGFGSFGHANVFSVIPDRTVAREAITLVSLARRPYEMKTHTRLKPELVRSRTEMGFLLSESGLRGSIRAAAIRTEYLQDEPCTQSGQPGALTTNNRRTVS